MYRGSSFLLLKNYSIYSKLIDYLSELEDSYWGIDLDSYTDENIDKILKVYNKIREIISEEHKHSTLITKIMLGVFGNVPAFDKYFLLGMKSINGKGFTVVNKNSLNLVKDFYISNSKELDKVKIKTRLFEDQSPKTQRYYPLAKLVDMVHFVEGRKTN
jgi:hypothetical protein